MKSLCLRTLLSPAMSACYPGLQPLCHAHQACSVRHKQPAAAVESQPPGLPQLCRLHQTAVAASHAPAALLHHRRQQPRNSCRCRSGLDADKVMFSDEVPLSKLQQQLDQAIDDEDYAAAAVLRDAIQRRRFDSRLAVEEANDQFYKAFQSGSLAKMSEVWGNGEHVQCIHPLCGCIAGRQAVMDSWKAILGSARMRIQVEDVRIFATDNHAFVTCLEMTKSEENRGRIVATNVFEKQGGAWKLVHHHGSPIPAGAR